jgi:transcription-repair coupling factor (superfamily II helicase)
MIYTSFIWELNDWLIHVQHGVGRYVGVRKILANGMPYECLGIEYGDHRTIWTPVTCMTQIGYFAHKTKNITPGKRALRKLEQFRVDARKWVDFFLAQEQLRNTTTTQPLKITSPVHPHYELTSDQRRCINDIASDLRSGRLMNRLVCGDVCTGKTEVALQAARMILENKGQVVLMVPTTVLAKQHYNLFRSRLPEYKVTCMTRTADNKQAIMNDCASGSIDVLISTHGIVRNTNWNWQRLGLVIVDEEHCFGTEDKERAKFGDVHYLSMTATPLPQTAYTVLNKGRAVSILDVMPEGRELAHTHVTDKVDISALVKPYGQVVCICHKISEIENVRASVARQLEASGMTTPVFTVHGKMQSEEIEAVLEQATNTDGAVLISTALVGVGFDHDSIHTLVVFDSHNWGLSQLHQLRGRVSRGKERGNAYFLSSAQSLERLQLLLRHNTAGSGWILAQKDMELRGAGSALGTKQSGHLADIGIDMTHQLMREAEGRAILVDIRHMRYVIPDSYMPCDAERVYWYKRLAHIDTPLELQHTRAKICETYGPEPEGIKDFWRFHELKIVARDLGIKRISGGTRIVIDTYDNSPPQYHNEIHTLDDLDELLGKLAERNPQIAVSSMA